MRHRQKRHKLGRTKPHRKATLAALSTSLIAHKRITTTVPKAKALRGFIEPLITRAKEDTSHNRRQVFRRLQDKQAVTTLFTDVSEQVGDRPGGYTRVIKLGRRAGDGAHLAMIELVDYNDVQPDTEGGGRKRTRRGGGKGRRRSKPKGADSKSQPAAASGTETADQVESAETYAESDTVEKPVADEQATPVTERTADEAPDDQVDAAEAAIEEQKASKKKAEAEAAATDEATAKEKSEASAEAEQPEAAADDEKKETAAEADQASAKGESEASNEAEADEEEPDKK